MIRATPTNRAVANATIVFFRQGFRSHTVDEFYAEAVSLWDDNAFT